MEVNGYDVKHIENATGVANSQIYNFLNHKRLPKTNTAIKIADLFKCPLDFLFGFVDDFKPKEYKCTATVNERVRKLIDKTNLSHYQISQNTGISESQLSYWYNNKRVPNLLNLIILAEKFDCSLDFLVGRD